MRQFDRQQAAPAAAPAAAQPSQLAQWPCQIKLVPVNAPYFDGAKLLIAADCTAYAYANIQSGVHARPCYPHRLPQAGCCGLQREAD